MGIPAGPDVAVMDEVGNLLSAGEVGEIVIRGLNVTQGYENNLQANQKAFTNGWFRTGDQGYFDRDGYLFLTGRLKEIINRGGEKISPREVDEVLMAHPAVAQIVAFAVPHPTLGEDVAAAVVLQQQKTATEQQLREFASQRLTEFKVPSQIVFLDEIPLGPTGKLQRIGLAEKLAQPIRPAFVAPQTDIEKILGDIWTEVLRVKRYPDSCAYNNPFVLRLTGKLLPEVLEKSINEIIRRHEILRTTFTQLEGKPVQVIAESLTLPLKIIDLKDLPPQEREAEAKRLSAQEDKHHFDLVSEPLIKTTVVRFYGDDGI